MPARTNWTRVQSRHRVLTYDREHPSPRIRAPRIVPTIPLHARLFSDGRLNAAVDAAVAAYWINRDGSHRRRVQ